MKSFTKTEVEQNLVDRRQSPVIKEFSTAASKEAKILSPKKKPITKDLIQSHQHHPNKLATRIKRTKNTDSRSTSPTLKTETSPTNRLSTRSTTSSTSSKPQPFSPSTSRTIRSDFKKTIRQQQQQNTSPTSRLSANSYTNALEASKRHNVSGAKEQRSMQVLSGNTSAVVARGKRTQVKSSLFGVQNVSATVRSSDSESAGQYKQLKSSIMRSQMRRTSPTRESGKMANRSSPERSGTASKVLSGNGKKIESLGHSKISTSRKNETSPSANARRLESLRMTRGQPITGAGSGTIT
eukprot:CAMPEP_0115037826 /NCGR_PEP_ID=MMETSP0216-20121206/43044_1 /TAXON_ID=223996 /ORGANISM="Protocruzia adherens, Strain Boccale" /LENGTH=295 /DNA_ID=CAMNT_0002418109 /DNA_START=66 /DNA_END=949 /DNA_ORIENTATION=+